MVNRLRKTPIIGKKLSKRHGVFCTLIATVAALMVSLMGSPAQLHAEEGRIHVTFLKGGYGSGSGYLFFQGHKYGLGVSSAKIRKIWITTIDLNGTAFNLHNPEDVIGTYTAKDAEAATVTHAKVARLENEKGVIVEIRAVNLNRLFSLNLSEIKIKNLGWQPSPE